jgi:hypothetical protein
MNVYSYNPTFIEYTLTTKMTLESMHYNIKIVNSMMQTQKKEGAYLGDRPFFHSYRLQRLGKRFCERVYGRQGDVSSGDMGGLQECMGGVGSSVRMTIINISAWLEAWEDLYLPLFHHGKNVFLLDSQCVC